MSLPDELPTAGRKPVVPALVMSLALALFIFAATYFTYYSRHQSLAPGGYAPLAVGVSAFFVLMFWFNYVAFPARPAYMRIVKSGGIALAGAAVFLLLLLSLILNTIGS